MLPNRNWESSVGRHGNADRHDRNIKKSTQEYGPPGGLLTTKGTKVHEGDLARICSTLCSFMSFVVKAPGPTHLKCYMRERFREMRWGDGESPEVFCGVNGPARGANAGTSTGRDSVDSRRGGIERSR